jgi:hypothetical protein
MKSIFMTMLCVSIFGHAFAQNQSETLKIVRERFSRYQFDFEQGNKLTIYARKVRTVQQFQNLDSTLSKFAKDYAALKPSLSDNTNSRSVTYKQLPNGQHQLDLVEHPAPKQRFYFSNTTKEPLLIKTVQDTLLLIINELPTKDAEANQQPWNESLVFQFLLNSLDNVDNLLETKAVSTKITEALQRVGAYSGHDLMSEKFKFWYNENPKNGRQFVNVGTYNSNFLALHPTVGIGVLRNQLVPNFQLDASFVLDKSSRVGYTVGWRSMYFTERNDLTQRLTTQRSGFLQAGLTFYDFRNPQLKRGTTEQVLFGVYLGRLMTGQNSVFEKNTWNLSMTVATKGLFKIQPEIYFDGFFKNVMPSLRVQIGF